MNSARLGKCLAVFAVCVLTPASACRGDREFPRGIPPWIGGQGGAALDLGDDCSLPQFPCGIHVVHVRDLHLDLYFVVDRSTSMAEMLDDSTTWLVESLRAVTDTWSQHAGAIRIGATLLPEPTTDCDPGIEVWALEDCEDATESEVLAGLVDALSFPAAGRTPVATTFDRLRQHPPAFGSEALAILVTDGKANCEGPECLDQCTAVSIASFRDEVGVDVVVVAAAPSAEDVDVLNDYAMAGGRPLVGAEKFLRLEDGAGPLMAYVDEVVGARPDPCTIPLDEVPNHPEFVDVFFDCTVVPSSDADGWSWAAEDVIALNGAACDAVRGFDVEEITVVEGCGPDGPAE